MTALYSEQIKINSACAKKGLYFKYSIINSNSLNIVAIIIARRIINST